jgi:hypothetical protein
MKRIDLVRHPEKTVVAREGKQHTLYLNRQTKKSAAVPRHREIPTGTARSICRALGVVSPV